MSRFSLIALISACEVIHVVTQDRSLWIGKVRDAYSEIDDDILRNAKVNMIYYFFGSMQIEVAL